MLQLNTMVLFIMMVLVTYRGHANPTISTSTPTPCYGDVVTLVCHHPEVVSNRSRYFAQTPVWKEDDTIITIADGTIYTTETVADLTQTLLNITITVDHFRDKSFKYSCELLLANKKGWPSGEVETSEEVTVDPVDLTPPRITNMDPQEYNITVRWTPQPCNYAVVYFVSWNYTNDYGTTTNGSGVSYQVTNYTIPISIQGVYTVSIQAVDGVGNVGPATSEVVRSTYPRPTADAPPCEEGPLVLTCLASGLHNDRRSHFMWMDRNGNLTNSTVYTITGPQLMIANVSALSGEEHKAIRCCEVLSNGIVVEGVHYYVEPLNHPGPPEVIIATTDSTISLAWNTALRCFESEEFTFVVIWNEIGSGTIANVTTSSSPYTISGLQPNTSYQISVQGVGGSGVVSGIRVHSVTTLADTPTKGNKSTIVVAIAVVVSVIIIVAAGLVITLMATNCLKTNVRGNYDTGSRAHDPNPSAAASSNPFSSRLSGTCYYAQIDFERNPQTTIPPPPVEGVTYAEPVVVGEEDSQTNDGETKSELPTKQQPHHNSRIFEKFRFDVVDALVSIGVNYFGAVETGKVVHFTAEYNSIHFVVTCMYTSSDVTPEDIGHVVEAKQVTGSTKGLLISNQPTIPSKRLLTLENAGCQFVSVDGYGEKGWELKMIDKFKDVLPKVANGGESEDLTISKQKTTPPLSSIIQPGLGTGPAPVQHSNNNTNNNTNKRGTVFDEHCVESQEETPLCQNDSSTSTFRSSEDKKITTFVKTEFYALDNQNARVIFSEVANDDSEHEDLRTPEQVVDSSSMVLPEYPPPPKTSPPPDYQGGLTSNDSKSHDDPFMYQGGFTTPIVGGQYTMYMPPITNGLFMSSFECKLSNEEEEVLHMRVPWEEVEEEEAIPTPVQETPLTTCSLVSPLTAASTSNLEYPEEPLPTAAFVASEKCPEMLPMAVNESLHECPDLLKADDANIYPEPDSVDTIISESTDLRPANQAPTQFSGKTHRFFDGLETAFGPSQHQQNWGLWTSKKTESIQRVRKRNDMAYNEKGKLCCTFFHWSAHLFQTALHHSGALLVV